MPNEKFDQITVLNKDASLDGISVKQQANGRGSALRVDSDTTTAPALVVQGSGDLLDLRNSSGVSQFSVDQDGDLTFSGTLTPTTLDLTGAATTTDVVTIDVTGDTQQRLIVNADGTVEWGSGSAAVDTNLYRSAANTLKTDDALTVAGAVTAQSTLSVTSTTALSAAATVTAAAATNTAYAATVTADSFDRFRILADGDMEWGSGAAARDTTLYRGAANSLVTDDSLHVVGNALGTAGPTNHSLVAWAYDPTHNVNSSQLTNGTVYLSAVYVARSVSVTKLYAHITTAATTPTAGQNFIGIYDSSGTRLQNVDISTETGSTGLLTGTITSQALTPGSFYWIALVVNAVAAPFVARASGATGIGTVANVGLTAATYRYATNGTGQTTLPTSITPGSNSAASFAGPWVAVGA